VKLEDLLVLLGVFCHVVFAGYVLSRGVTVRVHQLYFLFGLMLALWGTGAFVQREEVEESTALLAQHVVHAGLLGGAIFFLHITLWMVRSARRRGMSLVYLLGAGALVWCLFPGLPVADIWKGGGVVFQPMHVWVPVIVLAGGVGLLSMAILLFRRAGLKALERKKVDALFVAQSVLLLCGINDALPAFGVLSYPLVGWDFKPMGSVIAVGASVVVGYGVLQNQVLDFHLALGRFAAHLIRLTALFFIGLCLLTAAAFVFPEESSPRWFAISMAVVLASGAVASLLFPKLFGMSGELLERRIVGDQFEYHEKIRAFINALPWQGEIQKLLKDLHGLFLGTLGVRSYQIILLDEATRIFSVFQAHPPESAKSLPGLDSGSPVLRHFEKARADYVSRVAENPAAHDTRLEREVRDFLQDFDAEYGFRLAADGVVFGLILLGPKATGVPYTATDIALLGELAKHLSLTVHQIRLKHQILQAEEMELLGRMSRGMAHDLNNLLTPINTLMQLASEQSEQEIDRDLLSVSLRNLSAIKSYIREALFFSENRNPDFQLHPLDAALLRAVQLMETQLARKGLQAVIETPEVPSEDLTIEMDEVLIQRMIGNVLANAIDATASGGEGGQIRITLTRLGKTETRRDWLRISIADDGMGIPQDNMTRVFTPYFTTKNRGENDRGFGLGLAICRKIAHLHGGNLQITSQLGHGTTVQLDLPTRQRRVAEGPAEQGSPSPEV